MAITHAFVNPKSDGGDTTIVRPSDWNAAHAVDTLTLVGGTVTASTPVIDAAQTWNNAAVTFTGIKLNVTATARADLSKLLDIQIGGTTQLAFVVTAGAPQLNFGAASSSNPGLRALGANVQAVKADGSAVAGFAASAADGYVTPACVFNDSTLYLGYSGAKIQFGSGGDPTLYRDAAEVLAIRDGTNATSLRVYNTFTDASNYERGFMRWNSNVLEFGAEALGTGTQRATRINGAVATPAGGSTTAVLLFGTTSGFGIYYGSGAPTVTAAAGSLYIRTDNAGASLRLYSNTTGSTTWAAITSA